MGSVVLSVSDYKVIESCSFVCTKQVSSRDTIKFTLLFENDPNKK